MDKIFVKDLRVDCIIGILESERVKTQPLLVSMELEKDLKECAKTGDLDKSINYAALSERVKVISFKEKLCYLKNWLKNFVSSS